MNCNVKPYHTGTHTDITNDNCENNNKAWGGVLVRRSRSLFGGNLGRRVKHNSFHGKRKDAPKLFYDKNGVSFNINEPDKRSIHSSHSATTHDAIKLSTAAHDVTIFNKEKPFGKPSFQQRGVSPHAGNLLLVDSDVIMRVNQKSSSEPVFNNSECVANTRCACLVTGVVEPNKTTEPPAPKVADNKNQNNDNDDSFGPVWPSEFKSNELIPALLSLASSVTQTLKKHVHYVHGYMKFMNDSTSCMPIEVITAYERLINKLTIQNHDLNLSDVKDNTTVLHCVEVIHYLIDETKFVFRELERCHKLRERDYELIVHDNYTVYSMDLSYPGKSQRSGHSRNSVCSKHTSYHTSRSMRSTSRVYARKYSKTLRSSHSYRSVENAEAERVSILRDYQIATSNQNAQRQQRQLENEIAYENLKTAALIEKRKAEVDVKLKLQSAKRKLELSNKCVEIETNRRILEEKRQLNEYGARRALSAVMAGEPVQ